MHLVGAQNYTINYFIWPDLKLPEHIVPLG